jgi:2-dehydropantoate 2-reductase
MSAQRIGILGCGAVGLYYGTRLMRSGADVHFLMRSDAPVARRRGIEVRAKDAVESFFPVQIAAAPEALRGMDWIVIATKATSNHELPSLLAPAVESGARLLTLQNGLGHDAELVRCFPEAHVAGGLCFVCLNRIAPATVLHIGHGNMMLGEASGPPTPELQALAALWENAGVPVECVLSLEEARWRKLVWNVPFNGLSIACGGVSVDRILSNPDLLARCRALMEEVRAIAATRGIEISREFLELQIQRTKPMGAYKPSSLLDFLAGRPVEIDAIWGAPLRLAREAGIDTPFLAALHKELTTLCNLR